MWRKELLLVQWYTIDKSVPLNYTINEVRRYDENGSDGPLIPC